MSDDGDSEDSGNPLRGIVVFAILVAVVPVWFSANIGFVAAGTELHAFLMYALAYVNVSDPAILWTLTTAPLVFFYAYLPWALDISEFFAETGTDTAGDER